MAPEISRRVERDEPAVSRDKIVVFEPNYRFAPSETLPDR